MAQKHILPISLLRSFKSRLANFSKREDGSIMAETIITLPIMLWAFLALFVYWDNYRSYNTVQKASYTISDMISREMGLVNEAYITGMRNVMQYMLEKGNVPRLRVTSIGFSGTNKRFEVMWSRSPGNALTPLTTDSLQNMTSRIPDLAEGDYVVLVETEVDYKPSFNVGIDNKVFKQFIVTRPRFVSPTCLTGASKCNL